MLQLRWMWKNLFGRRRMMVTALILAVVTGSAAIIVPKLTQFMVDYVLLGEKAEWLIPILLLMVLVPLIRFALRYLMCALLEHSTQHLYCGVKMYLFRQLLGQEQRFFDHYRTGDLITRMTGDLGYVRHAGAWMSYQIIDAITFVTAGSIMLAAINLPMTLFILAVTPMLLGLSFLYVRKVRPLYFQLRGKLSQLNTAAQENISGNRVVKAFAREDYEKEKFEQANAEYRDINVTVQRKWMRFWPVIEFFAQSLTVITLLSGGIFIINGRLTYGEYAAFSGMLWAFSGPIQNLGVILNDLQRVVSSIDKIMEIYYAKPTIIDRIGCIDDDREILGDIDFDHVTFRHGKTTVFSDLTLHIKAGSTVAVMGPTGSGKTTLLNLICRFYDVNSGAVRLDGVDVRDYSLRKLRSCIGLATQDVFLYSDTVAANIGFCRPGMSAEEAGKYAAQAGANGFVSEMADGYDTIIGERGVGLSGGQRQRIALARALAVRPRILMLDDTTSAVDSRTEEYIRSSLANLDFPCTKIITAQRISSVKDADAIFILENGGVTVGTHETLISRPGYYREICELQHEPGLPDLPDAPAGGKEAE